MSQNIDRELERFVREYGFVRPDRGDLDNPSLQWREGKPDYRKADLLYFQGKSKNHEPGSLKMAVENLVKKWEMEMTHLPHSKDWTTVELNEYCVQVNGGREISAEEAVRVGTYNWVMENAPKNLYDAQSHTFESSHRTFRGAFIDGFTWELLEVFSGPPKVAFTWRHWGIFNGEYNGRKGQDEMIELYGFAIATVSDSMKIKKVEVYAKFDGFLQALQGKISPFDLEKGKEFIGSCCPLHKPKNTD